MSDPMADRLPPQNRDAERSILGGVLRDPDTLNVLQMMLKPENFYQHAHQLIFQALIDLYAENQPIDLVLLHDKLRKNKQLEDVGGPGYLMDLWESVPTGANAEYHAKIVRDTAMIRSLIHAGNEILRDSYDRTQSADELVSTAERKIMDIAKAGMIGETYTLGDAVHDALTRLDSRIGKDNLALSGLPTGYVDLDNITAGLQKSELIIIAARPSVGKCLSADAEIVLADGSVATIEELYRRREASLFTLGDDWQLRPTSPSVYVDDGVKPVFRVRTRLGRVIETTACHPFRTLRAWQPLSQLAVGDRIAVPRRMPVFGTVSMRECEVKLLGYLLGDGGLSDTTPEFTNPRLRDDFADAVADFGGERVGPEAGSRRLQPAWASGPRSDSDKARGDRQTVRSRPVAVAGVGCGVRVLSHPLLDTPPTQEVGRRLKPAATSLRPDPTTVPQRIMTWLSSLGLHSKPPHDKFVPACVFTLPREQVSLFLNRMFATDGWATVLGEGQTQLGYCSVSERMIRQVQHLLLRFGIVSQLRERAVKYRDTRRPAWQLDITDARAIRTFADEIGMFGKEDALGRVEEKLKHKRYQTNRDLIPAEVWDDLAAVKGERPWAELAERIGLCHGTNLHVGKRDLSRARLAKFAAALGSESLAELATSDVYWDTIVSVEPLGPKQVYDLTIPETHNFVANDVCVHNTAFALNLVRNIIIEQHDHAPPAVLFFSLEQSRIELAERLLCCQSRVDSHRVRKGHLNSDDIQKLMDAGDHLRRSRLYIDDTPSRSMLQIGATARRLQKKHEKEGGLRLVVIDYLQLIEPENRRDPRQEQVAQISRRLKFLARELNIPVIALAQVNRASEDRQDHKPRLADLRESGSIEQDADTCMMLHRPAKFDGAQEDNILEIIIAKQRNGPTGEITLTYFKQYMRYENYIADAGYGGGV